MADMILGIDWDITKAEAKQRKLNREFDESQKKANLIGKNIEKLKEELVAEERLQKEIKDTLKEQVREAAELEEKISKVKNGTATISETMDLGPLNAAEEKLKGMENAIKNGYKELDKSNSRHDKISNQIDKQNLKLKEQNNKTATIGDNIALNSKKQNKFGNALKKSNQPLEKFGRRIRELIKSALIFSVITKALNAMKEALGQYLKQDSKLSNSISKLKGNLATIGATLSSSVAPILQWITDRLVYITSLVGATLARFLGKDVKEMVQLAKATKKTADEVKKATAGFDTLQMIDTSEKDSKDEVGIDTTAIENVDDSQIDSFIDKLKTALPYVIAIGLGLTAWNIMNFLKQFEKISSFLTGGTMVGILMIVVGAVLLIWNLCDAWINGLDWGNFTGILIGVALIVGGLALAFGSIAAGIGAIVGGIAMVVIGIKDWIENGKSLKSVLMVVVGILAVGLGLMLLGLGWPALLVAAIVAAIVVIAAYWEEIKSAVSKFIEWFSENVLDKLFGKGFGDAIQGMWKSFTQLFEDIIYFFKCVFTGKWKEAGKALVNILIDIINFFINKINAALQFFLGGGAKLINGIGKLFGAEWNLDASSIKIPTIPRLATGAVIPGGSPFLAMLGDQRKGQTNIEAPLDTIVDAFKAVQGGQKIEVKFTGSLAQLARVLAPEITTENTRASVFAKG